MALISVCRLMLPLGSAPLKVEISNGPTGMVAAGFERVQEEFLGNFTERGEAGAAFAAVLDGRPVVDLWGGLADKASGQKWSENTLQLVWSGTKGFVAVCILMLIERGLVDLDATVARYWPEFARNGKAGVLVKHVLSHTAGLPGLHDAASNEQFVDCQVMARLLEDERPIWAPGSHLYYHSFTYGWLCAELVRRTDGRSIGRFFADEVAGPLGLELWIGLPAELEPRLSTLHLWPQWNQSAAEGSDPVRRQVWTGPPLVLGEPLPWNTRTFHAAEIPGANAIGTARSIARLYGCLARGGEIDEVRLLRSDTVQLGQKCLATGRDAITGSPRAFGVGFALQTDAQPFGPVVSAFGHGGAGGSMHGAWPVERIGFSYSMNEMRDELIDSRAQALLRALHVAVKQTTGHRC